MKNIITIEDHHESYWAWKKRKFQNKIILHLDAHVDFGWFEVKEPAQILKEAKTLSEIKNFLEKKILFSRYEKTDEKLYTIGNYLYPALRDKIAKEIYWVIPGNYEKNQEDLKGAEKLLQRLKNQDPLGFSEIKGNKILKTKLYGHPFYVCFLEGLPKINEKVLLNIDTDFFVIESIKKATNTALVSKRDVWIWPKEVLKILKDKGVKPLFTTISYSVNGGFTPLSFKYLGDEMFHLLNNLDVKQKELFAKLQTAYSVKKSGNLKKAIRLYENLTKKPIKKPFLAAIYFQLFLLFWEKGQKKKAVFYYQKAKKLDGKYGVYDNNFGPPYLLLGKKKEAKKEFEKIVFVDPKNAEAFAGLGEAYLLEKNYQKAKREFEKSLSLKKNKKAIFGKGLVYFYQKNYKEAEKYFEKYSQIERLQPQVHLFLAKVYENLKEREKAKNEYQETIRLGYHLRPDVYFALFRLEKNPKNLFRGLSLLPSYLYQMIKNKIQNKLAFLKGF